MISLSSGSILFVPVSANFVVENQTNRFGIELPENEGVAEEVNQENTAADEEAANKLAVKEFIKSNNQSRLET